MTGNRKLYLTGGFFAVCFVVATFAMFFPPSAPRATFSDWAGFMQVVSIGLGAVFTVGNVGEHVSGAIKKNGAA